MRYSFSQQKSPVIIGVVREETAEKAICAIRNCILRGATGIDLHISCLQPEFREAEGMKPIIDACTVPLVAVNYNGKIDRSPAGFGEEERLEMLYTAALAGADAIDMQGYSFDEASRMNFDPAFAGAPYSFISGNPHEIVVNPAVIEKQKAFIDRIHTTGAQVMITNHPGIYMHTNEVLDWVHFLEERNPDVLKIVLVAHDEDELAESFTTMLKLTHEKIPISLHCSGYGTKYSRIVNPILGGHIAFCVDGYRPYDDINQLDIGTMSAVAEGVRRLL